MHNENSPICTEVLEPIDHPSLSTLPNGVYEVRDGFVFPVSEPKEAWIHGDNSPVFTVDNQYTVRGVVQSVGVRILSKVVGFIGILTVLVFLGLLVRFLGGS